MDMFLNDQLNQEYFTSNSLMIVDGSIDESLVNSNLSLSTMIDQYGISSIDDKEKKTKQDLFCAVCNAKAFGYNFDQISCESCKAFFRRNALKDIKELQCRFSSSCNVTVETRRHCSYCRIKKCFAVGMRKEWIRSEEEKQKRRGQIKHTRHHKFAQELIKISPLSHSVPSFYISILTALERVRLNNIIHCYDQFSCEPSACILSRLPSNIQIRVNEFFDRKKPIFVNLITHLKQLPEFQTIHVDDQVKLVKQNLRLVSPMNYALIRVSNSQITVPNIQTIGCINNINIHHMYRSLADIFIEIAVRDPIILKLFLIISFFTTDSVTTISILQLEHFEELRHIKNIQSSYVNLLWSYMLEKCGEINAILLFTKMITKYLHIQTIVNEMDSIIRVNDDVQKIDGLMQTILQLT
ncbi:hypothetical protein I4U23_013592 [Adineta vaga]|nr:hypothetical protein I4U23_013592 [Adineta vaga]